jgi:RNA polymerase sigma-70 factor (ECF subfamily)
VIEGRSGEDYACAGMLEGSEDSARERSPHELGEPRGSAPISQVTSAVAQERLRRILTENFAFTWRQLRRLGVPHGAVDDAAQEVFLVASRKLDTIAPGSERSFLFGTALRIAARVRRLSHVRHEVPHEPSTLEGEPVGTQPTFSPEDLLDQKRARVLLDDLLGELDDDLRAALVLFELEGLSTPEIAALLDIPLGTAASRVRRAREEFQAKVVRWKAKGRER